MSQARRNERCKESCEAGSSEANAENATLAADDARLFFARCCWVAFSGGPTVAFLYSLLMRRLQSNAS